MDKTDLPVLPIAMPVLQKHSAFGRPLTFDKGTYEVTTSTALLNDLVEAGYRAGEAVERARADALEKEVEQLRVQLAGCGVAAMGNTRDSLKANSALSRDAYGWSASYSDVLSAVTREVECRERADALEAVLRRIIKYNDEMPDNDDWSALMEAARALLEKKT